VSLIPAHEHEDAYPIQHYLIRFVCDFSPGMLVSSINKSYLHDITCLLLQVTFKMYIKKFEDVKEVTLALKIDIHSTAKMDPVLHPHFNSFSLTYINAVSFSVTYLLKYCETMFFKWVHLVCHMIGIDKS
jgi:hypothetical protein